MVQITVPDNKIETLEEYSSNATISQKTEYKPVGGSGWIEHFIQLKKNGYIYPRIVGSEHERGCPEDYPHHYYWRYCWLDRGKKRSRSVSRNQLQSVRYAIANRTPAKEILKGIGRRPP